MRLIGGHVSIAGGFDRCIDRAEEIGANCLQTFASSPRSLSTKPFSDEELDLYRQKKVKANMGPHYFHGVYLINLAHENSGYVEASLASLEFYQRLAKDIGGEGTIFHLGSHKGAGFEAVKKQVAGAIEKALGLTPDGITLFLENAAGQSGSIGADLTQLRWLYDQISSAELRQKIGVCYDTQHGFSAGYDIRTQEAVANTVKQIDNQLGLNLVKVIHANDSKVALAGLRDRHENIGQGEIGKKGFSAFGNHPAFAKLPYLLEVPGENRSGPQAKDIALLRSLLG